MVSVSVSIIEVTMTLLSRHCATSRLGLSSLQIVSTSQFRLANDVSVSAIYVKAIENSRPQEYMSLKKFRSNSGEFFFVLH